MVKVWSPSLGKTNNRDSKKSDPRFIITTPRQKLNFVGVNSYEILCGSKHIKQTQEGFKGLIDTILFWVI